MSDGPLPESTRGVDSSPEAIAEMVARLRAPMWIVEPIDIQKLVEHCAALLAQVARERDEARKALRFLYRNGLNERPEWVTRLISDAFHERQGAPPKYDAEHNRIAAAERQLAEARAALAMVAHYGDAFREGTDMLAACRDVAVRALLSGETT